MARKYLPLLALLLAPGCLAAPKGKEELIMEEIERAVVLPAGAEKLDAYGRNYAWSGQGQVIATYLKPPKPVGKGLGCTVVLENVDSRPCTEGELAESSAFDARIVASRAPAGQRRWFDDAINLPFMSGGGCNEVDVKYDTMKHKVLIAECNGPY